MAARTTTRVPMPIKMRAKQFAMFDALKGLTEAIAEKEKQRVSRKELSDGAIEAINIKLKTIKKGDFISVEYYCQYSEQYKKVSGTVSGVDSYWKFLQINTVSINFNEIIDIYKDVKTENGH